MSSANFRIPPGGGAPSATAGVGLQDQPKRARQGPVTLLDVAAGQIIEPPLAAHPSVVLAAWRLHLAGKPAVFIGDAAERDAALIAEAGGQWTIVSPPPLAPALARIAAVRAARGEAGLPHLLTPIYVRRPDVEIERERRTP